MMTTSDKTKSKNSEEKRMMRHLLQRCAVLACATIMLASVMMAGEARAAYPDQTITMIIPLAAGSAVDNAARILAPAMSQALGQSIVSENQDGASGIIGAERVARANPDGYTIGAFNDSILTMVPNMLPNIPWDPIKDFAPVSLVTNFEWALVATPSLPYKTAADVIAAAKAQPGVINYATGGVGSPQHIAMALFAAANHLDMVAIPYKGATPAAVGIAGGEAQVGFSALPTVKSLLDGKKLHLLGISSENEIPQAPGVPTISESGSPGFQFYSWFVIVVPAGTPQPIVDRLNQAIKMALANPDVRAKLLAQGAVPVGSSPGVLGAAIKTNLAKYKKLIDDNHIKAN
jgi:tripartite-type tricarboxylate transporter receptor subunit TctC